MRQPWALLNLPVFVRESRESTLREAVVLLAVLRSPEFAARPQGHRWGAVLRMICVAATLSKSEPSNQASRAHGESSAEGPASSSGVGATPSSCVGDAPIGWCASKRSLCRARAPTDVHDLAKHGGPFIFAHHQHWLLIPLLSLGTAQRTHASPNVARSFVDVNRVAAAEAMPSGSPTVVRLGTRQPRTWVRPLERQRRCGQLRRGLGQGR